jgi:NAD(P)-dependent dehydrogenase (short-subunit alcohol dehydrogenase family)
VTGAGGGIGTRIAVALAVEGCNLCLSDKDMGALRRVRDEATQRGGAAVRIVCVHAELRHPADIAKLAKACEDAYGRCDYLLNVGTARCLTGLPKCRLLTSPLASIVLCSGFRQRGRLCGRVS